MKIQYPTNIPFITQNFGAKSPAYVCWTDPRHSFHHGTDLRTWNEPKKEILAVADGEVIDVDSESTGNYYKGDKSGSVYGVHCILRHFIDDKVYFTLYGHLEKVYVSTGQKVKAGDIIGKGGNTGKSQGEHLHFELREDKNYWKSAINAEPYFEYPEQASEWAKEAQDWVKRMKISDGTKPHDAVTREEMWTMLYRTFNK